MSQMRRPAVLSWPASRSSNPFPGQVVEELSSLGFDAAEIGVRALLRRDVGTLVIHWPERIVRSQSDLKTAAHVGVMGAVLATCVLRRIKIILFMHNFRSHDRFHPQLEDRFYRLFDRTVSGVIHLSEYSRENTIRHRPMLERAASTVVRHGTPVPLVASQPVESAPDHVTLTTFGAMRRYKGYESLVEAVAELDDLHDLRVILLGSSPTDDLRADLRAASMRDDRLTLEIGFLSADELGDAIRRASAVIVPYENILNSGSAIHVLAEGGRVIAPRTGSLPELQEDVGSGWLHLYEPPLSSAALRKAIEWAATPKPNQPADLSAYQWKSIGPRIAQFIDSVTGLSE